MMPEEIRNLDLSGPHAADAILREQAAQLAELVIKVQCILSQLQEDYHGQKHALVNT